MGLRISRRGRGKRKWCELEEVGCEPGLGGGSVRSKEGVPGRETKGRGANGIRLKQIPNGK